MRIMEEENNSQCSITFFVVVLFGFIGVVFLIAALYAYAFIFVCRRISLLVLNDVKVKAVLISKCFSSYIVGYCRQYQL